MSTAILNANIRAIAAEDYLGDTVFAKLAYLTDQYDCLTLPDLQAICREEAAKLLPTITFPEHWDYKYLNEYHLDDLTYKVGLRIESTHTPV